MLLKLLVILDSWKSLFPFAAEFVGGDDLEAASASHLWLLACRHIILNNDTAKV